ncbi:NAD(P)-binding protein [Melanomma pulvis-pyrius CBS 109.77]|uniref:NAD(P)-binding protein n=1 Tax=Melanomma pulvis-pyrius CBS 109.77 TaxID=1314802 RepID=A0A6A6XS24_9PLEO|nr:NAD(P)-binding protein [Melanomma pulvis-pyrius CBS 109.77]
MVNVAIAGGTGGVGRAIVDAFKDQPAHKLIVLSRKENPELEAQLNVPIVAIDYSSPATVQKTLDEHQIHTVISALSIVGQEHSDAQIALIRGAAASSHVKRFTPSEFGHIYQQKHLDAFPFAAFKAVAVAELEKTDLEFTLFNTGFFMDYFGIPKFSSYLTPVVVGLDIQNKVAGIPGSGNTPVIFTATRDVGKFVAASVGLEKWSRRSLMVGDRKTWNEILATAETVTGSKFEVHYDSVEKMKTGKITELPSHKKAYPFFPKERLEAMLALFGLWFDSGDLNYEVSGKESLNELFPEIQPLSISQVISEGWA